MFLTVVSTVGCNKAWESKNERTKYIPHDIHICSVDVVKEEKCDQNCFYNPESTEDIYLVHIEPKLRSVGPLTEPLANNLFWCRLDGLGPLAEKQWLPVDRVGALEV